MKYEITAQQLEQLANVFGDLPYRIIKPHEQKVADLIKQIESQVIKEEQKGN